MAKKKRSKKNKYSFKDIFSNIKWTYKTLYSLAPKETVLSLVFVLILASVPTAINFLFAKLIDEIIDLAESGVSNINQLGFDSAIFIIFTGYVLLRNFESIIIYANDYIKNKFSNYYRALLYEKLFYKISNSDIQQFEDPQLSDSFQKASDNINQVRQLYRVSISFLTKLISLIISAVISFSISPSLSVVIILLKLPKAWFLSKYFQSIFDHYNDNIQSFRKRWHLLEKLKDQNFIPEYKLTGSNSPLYKKIGEITNTKTFKWVEIGKDWLIKSSQLLITNILYNEA